MIGPALEAVLEWLTTSPDTCNTKLGVDTYEDGTGPDSEGSAKESVMGVLARAMTNLGILSPDAGQHSGVSKANDVSETQAPVSIVCGIMLHVLIASAQDVPRGTHPSVSSKATSPQQRQLFSPTWVDRMAERASEHNICINVWGVSPFASQVLGLSELSPLVSKTGGKTFRFLLGTTPVAERFRLSLQLSRALSEQYASKCILKLRASQLVDMSTELMGHVRADPLLPGVNRICCCGHESTVACFLDYLGGTEGTSYSELEHLVVQIAFSYETLVEAEDSSLPKDDENDCFEEEQDNGIIPSPHVTTHDSSYSTSDGSIDSKPVEASKMTAMTSGSNSAIRNRMGVETSDSRLMSELEKAEYMDQETVGLGADESYRRFSERICHLKADSAFRKEHLRELEELSRKNKSAGKMNRYKGTSSAFTGEHLDLGFSHNRKLISVKRLRIITIALDCSNKIPRLLGGTRPEVLSVLIAREVLFNVDTNSSNSVTEGVVRIIGGLFEWAKKITFCAARAYFISKLGRRYGNRERRENSKNSADSDGISSEMYESLIAESVDVAIKDSLIQTSLYIIFGAMARVIGGYSDNNNALTISTCLKKYFGEDQVVTTKVEFSSAVPARNKTLSPYTSDVPDEVPDYPKFCFSDRFSEVCNHSRCLNLS